MKTAVVMTTIYPPSRAVRAFADKIRLPFIVVGDKKTPVDWSYPGAAYIDINSQKSRFPSLSELIPVNHYSRKNIGYLVAAKEDIEAIYETDDDNIPEDDWFLPISEGNFNMIDDSRGFVNIYSYFTSNHIWPRGFPLQEILKEKSIVKKSDAAPQAVNVGVWQGLADGDPDVDAIYRLILNKSCFFDKRPPVVLGRGVYCPYNSQNTLTFRRFFPLLYLPSHVNFRYTDILRGLIGQVLLQFNGSALGFYEATVFQDRNVHDFYRDFVDEMPCYHHPYDVIEISEAAVRTNLSINDNLFNIYHALGDRNIIRTELEIPILEAWLKELTL